MRMRMRQLAAGSLGRHIVAGCLAPLMLTGCGGWWPGKSDGPLPERLPPGAVEYTCAASKRLITRIEPDGKSAWIFFTDRQFRLDRDSASGARYSNATTALTVEGDTLRLDEDGRRTYDECKRKQAS